MLRRTAVIFYFIYLMKVYSTGHGFRAIILCRAPPTLQVDQTSVYSTAVTASVRYFTPPAFVSPVTGIAAWCQSKTIRMNFQGSIAKVFDNIDSRCAAMFAYRPSTDGCMLRAMPRRA